MDQMERAMFNVVNHNRECKALARRIKAISHECDLFAERINAISSRRRRKVGLFGWRK